MKVFRQLDEWRAFRRGLNTRDLGLVPTMGGLHAGHGALIQRSVEENRDTVVTLFLNPTQFDQAADLAGYPADTEQDLEALRAWGVAAVLLPDRAQMYPDDYRYRVHESELSRRFCGVHRPGHFDGVLTVVLKLLNLVQARRAYFGEKDWQQLELIRGMSEALFLATEIVSCPTVRAADGLALSSRNARLTGEQRALAPKLYASLRNASSSAAAARELAELGFKVDYVEDSGQRRLAAATLGDTRLIDNVPLEVTDGR